MNEFIYWSVGLLISIGLLSSVVFLLYPISRMANRCFLIFHRWTDWKYYDRDLLYSAISDNGERVDFKGIERRRQRVCVVCQKVQDEFVEQIFL